MTRIIVAVLLILGAVACLVGVWLSNRRFTRELDRWGVVYRCGRWPGESNASYYTRLRERVGVHWRGP